MIRPLRQRHRKTIPVLAFGVFVIFIAGIASRQTIPTMQQIPPLIEPSTVNLNQLLLQKFDLWPNYTIITRIYTDNIATPTRMAVQLEPLKDLSKPDVLIYWHPAESPIEHGLPGGAYFVGSLSSHQSPKMLLPERALQTDGRLILYSLAHQEVISSTLLPTRVQPSEGTP